ncbi:MAG: lipopolysaccharide assembly protein LapA domain-containing protein [Lautropia sp.]
MRLIAWFIKLAIFLVLLGFALGNTDPVRMGFFGQQDIALTAPLVVFLLMFFLLGLLLGLVTLLPRLYRQRRELARAKRDFDRLQRLREPDAGSGIPGASVTPAGSGAGVVGAARLPAP